ncbi:MAG: radical SAM protein [Desulfobacteraceae bacterium]|nr:radical SAM protein [Desulfobacteraceae bacterium]
MIRPPSEAESIIMQVTVGCAHNRCTFCGAYQGVRFRLKDEATVDGDLRYAARHFRHLNRIFLADGDVLILDQHRLAPLLVKIRERLPWVRRIRLYGSGRSLRAKTLAELEALKALGLDRIYLGLESGDDAVLSAVAKGSTAAQMIAAGRRARQAGIFLSVTVLLGLAGVRGSQGHALATAEALNQMAPNQIAALTVMPVPGTPLYHDLRAGRFSLPDWKGILRELKTMLQHLTLDKTQFQANHASNFLPLDCRLARDKEAALARIDQALAGRLPLMPDYLRSL